MIIYNVTINVDDSVHDEWLDWIKHHIPLVLSTGRFKEARLTRVLVDETMEGTTYAVQYRANSRKDLDDYYEFYADKLRQDSMKRFGDKVLPFVQNWRSSMNSL